MRTTGSIAALLAAAALLVAGCGGSDDGDGSATTDASAATSTTASTSSTTTSVDSGSDLDQIEATVKGWILEGGCDRMTDKFLEAQTFIDDPEKACEAFQGGFTPPQYTADDIETDISYVNDKATVEVSGGPADVTSVYKLVNEDGTWKIDSAELK